MITTEGIRMRYTVILEPEDEGGFHVWCPALKGCHSQRTRKKKGLKTSKKPLFSIWRVYETRVFPSLKMWHPIGGSRSVMTLPRIIMKWYAPVVKIRGTLMGKVEKWREKRGREFDGICEDWCGFTKHNA
jgi:hypothetical protein